MGRRKQFLLRIQPELWETIQRWAAAEFRSVNGQIEFLLQRAVDERRRPQQRDAHSDDDPGAGLVE